MSKKRDQRAYDLFQKYRFTFALRVLIVIVDNLDEPYTLKPLVGGVHGSPPWAMAIFVFIMEEFHLTCRGAVGYPNGHREKLKAMGPNKVPSKSTIYRNSAKIPDEYYLQVRLGDQGHSCRQSGRRLERVFGAQIYSMFSAKKDAKLWKKGWRKPHVLIDIRTRVILDYRITHACEADSPVMERLLTSMADRMVGKIGGVCFDSAYLTRSICNLISNMGRTPFIKPKSNVYQNHSEALSGKRW